MVKYTHIIWDWNGTLLDDYQFCIKIMNEMLKKRGMPVMTESWFLDNFCFPVKEYYLKLGFNFELEPFDQSGTEFIKIYMDRCSTLKLHEEAIDILEFFKQNEISQSLVSASSQKMLDEILKYHDIHDYFLKILGTDNHYANGKEDLTKNWINELELNYSEILFIGDTIHDKDIADTIGADCVLIAKGHVSKERLAKTGAPVFNGLNEIKNWI